MSPKQQLSLAKEINRMARTIYGDDSTSPVTIGLCEKQRQTDQSMDKILQRMNSLPNRIKEVTLVVLSIGTFLILVFKTLS